MFYFKIPKSLKEKYFYILGYLNGNNYYSLIFYFKKEIYGKTITYSTNSNIITFLIYNQIIFIF